MDQVVYDQIAEQVKQLMEDYKNEIEAAYADVDKALSIRFGVKLAPVGDGVNVQTSFGFTKGKIADKMDVTVGGKQMRLPGQPS